ncbi:putative bacterial ribosomal protein bL17 family protein [Teratosphaeria destructans]|uniref:Large ribosomal subunit protein bL17m n=1 Tax=Teratosphaeria destructans TaxID=418781 RepID=A0A9W7SXP0_9PEZI|nr:putative bacterial ribosomal protein bL17 family protein [Teratosphaeria destructans]
MAGGLVKYRHLSRKSSHRRALLRNLVTSLIEHESISTTWHKAKEAQRMAEKMITLGKRNTEASRREALKFFFRPHEMLPKLFGPLRERYQDRPGGYTRVLRIEPMKEDQAPSAILELVDGPKDMRFALTAKTIAAVRAKGHQINDMTAANIQKVTRYRKHADEELEEMVARFEKMATEEDEGVDEVKKKRVYPELPKSR